MASVAIPIGKKIAYSVHTLGVNVLWQAFNTVAVYFYVTELKVPGFSISLIMVIYGIVNAFLNLIAGHISDRTRTRFGRRIPYIVISALPFAAAFYLLFSPPAFTSTGLILYFAIMTFLFDVFFTLTTLNADALYPEMYPRPKDRALVSALQQVFSIIGMIIGVALAKSIGMSFGWQTMGWIFAGIGALSLYGSLYGCFENREHHTEAFRFGEAFKATFQNHLFVIYVIASFLIQLSTTLLMSVSSFYTKYVVPLDALQNSLFLGGIFIVAIPMAFVWARFALRYSTAKASLASVFIFGLLLLLFLVDASPAMLIGHGFLLGLPVAGLMVLLPMILADVIDIDAERTHRRREGMYLGMNGFIVRLGLSLQYAIMAIFFDVSGYDAAKSIQPAGTITGFRLLLGALPVVFILAAFVLLTIYMKRLTQYKKEAVSIKI